MMHKFSILLVILVVEGVAASAQSLVAFRDRLAEPSTTQSGRSAAVVVSERADAADVVARASRENARLRFKGYRVCIFFDNGQNARAGAESARALCTATYPEARTRIAYNSPYFTVTVGDCVTSEEAVILMGKVKNTFPKAFLKNEELSIADLIMQ